MAKFHGAIGYYKTEETFPGVWEEIITEREYFGDFIKNTKRFQSSEQLNDNINISNEISIVTDPYARDNFHLMRYVRFDGSNAKWKIISVEIQFPRLVLTIGGVYNEQET